MSSKSLSLGIAAFATGEVEGGGGCDDEPPMSLSLEISGLGICAGPARAFLRAEAAALSLEGEGETFVMPAAVCPEQRGGLGGGEAGRGILYGTATIRKMGKEQVEKTVESQRYDNCKVMGRRVV